MKKEDVVLSPREAETISGILELHICSGIASGASKNASSRIEEEIKELNKIQKKIELQLNVPGDRRM